MTLKYIGNEERTFFINGENVTLQKNQEIELSRSDACALLRIPFAGRIWQIIS